MFLQWKRDEISLSWIEIDLNCYIMCLLHYDKYALNLY